MTAPVPELRRIINGPASSVTVRTSALAAVLDAAEALAAALTISPDSQVFAVTRHIALTRWRELTGEQP